MIVIVSSSNREANILTSLCDFHRWPCERCPSVAAFPKSAQRLQPQVVIVRHQLEDGYSDDILAKLGDGSLSNRPKAVVLMTANCTAAAEARQIQLGADVVVRDPIRLPVMLEYVARFRTPTRSENLPPPRPMSWSFAGIEVLPLEHRISAKGVSVHVAPQEIELIQLLEANAGRVVTYPVMYGELFHQRFGGETANSRVLLGKLGSSFRKLGVDLRAFIQVIPKSGYLYTPAPAGSNADFPASPIDRVRGRPRSRLGRRQSPKR